MDPTLLASLGSMFGGSGGGLPGMGGGEAPGIEETNSQAINTRARGGGIKYIVRDKGGEDDAGRPVKKNGGEKGTSSTVLLVALALIAVVVLVLLAIAARG